jgi:hypothetical protein
MDSKEYIKKVKDLITPYLSEVNLDYTKLAKVAQGITPLELREIVEFTPSNEKRKVLKTEAALNLESNPIDYDWRYDSNTVNKIANLIKKRHSRIGCFGVPTIFKELANDTDIILFDINPFLKIEFPHHAEKVIQVDLNNNLVEGYEFDSIIMDPPWYNNYYSCWFKQAINNLKQGGTIYTSKYPPLVRPSAQDDWQCFIHEFGSFLSSENKELTLLYETPTFERETLESMGLYNIGNWRQAELVSFKLKEKKQQNLDSRYKDEWKRYRFGNNIVSIKLANDNSEELEVKSPYEDGSYTLKSVSQRHIARNQVNFITSRNKSLIIKGTGKVDLFLQKLSLNNNINTIIDNNYSQKDIQALKIIYSLIGI